MSVCTGRFPDLHAPKYTARTAGTVELHSSMAPRKKRASQRPRPQLPGQMHPASDPAVSRRQGAGSVAASVYARASGGQRTDPTVLALRAARVIKPSLLPAWASEGRLV